jgi:hypothetical protein
VDNVFNHDFIG